MSVPALAALPALTNGVAAGIMLATVIGVVPLMVASGYPQYVRMVQFMWPRYDPAMPILNGLSLALDVVLASTGPAAARGWYLAAAALLATVMAISITRNVPVNKFVSRLDPDDEPADWARIDPRRRWQRWNLTRTLIALSAFTVNILAAVAALAS
ncbi:DUF1772 domain-containing protein [Actinoplanes sp. TFC3]|uniref:DUF1772 domain-containing protein n=1 Tax=Actinoplanes sp. TFC3 TaxID=1710355 RepID=UPI0008325EEC|nr:DUF1772 domain-containing protein [Actinoplanes sp. TFC3]